MSGSGEGPRYMSDEELDELIKTAYAPLTEDEKQKMEANIKKFLREGGLYNLRLLEGDGGESFLTLIRDVDEFIVRRRESHQ